MCIQYGHVFAYWYAFIARQKRPMMTDCSARHRRAAHNTDVILSTPMSCSLAFTIHIHVRLNP